MSTISDEFIVPQSFWGLVRRAIKAYGLRGSVARYLLLKDERQLFLNRAKTPSESEIRKKLLKSFDAIQAAIPCAHTPHQFVVMAEYLLNLDIDGPIVQCGCFKGGSTAQLSAVANYTGRKLYVCDSFAGLPALTQDAAVQFQAHGPDGTENTIIFKPGQYLGELEEVKNNIKAHGFIQSCEFVPGLFADTLPNLQVSPAFVFIDVDYISSARDCLQFLWPRLKSGGYWFTHEAVYPDYLNGMLDANWWHMNLNECPPVLFGGGSGLSLLSPSIAYLRKQDK